MHKSRFAGLIIDCNSEDLDAAARFWGASLGLAAATAASAREAPSRTLETAHAQPHIQVQRVRHESRVHLDIESDDVAAEVARLERLGARRLESVQDWVVMQAPTGQRFCVVPAQRADFAARAHTWSD